MRSCLAAFSLGVIVVGFFSRLPSTNLVAIFVALTVLLLLMGVRSNNQVLAHACLLVGCLLLGALWHLMHAKLQMSQRLPSELEGVDIILTGVVVSLPEQRGAIQQFRFDIDPGSGPEGFRTSIVLLNYYGPATIGPAQRWRFTVRLKRPHGFANPGTFDYEAWLWQQQIGAKGYVRAAASNQQLVNAKAEFVPKHTLLKLRSKLRDKLISATQSLPNQSIIVALTLGDRSKLTDQQWALFSSTGTNHLVVVSGLHVGFFAGVCYLVVFTLWRLSSRCMLRLPAQKAGAIAAVSGAMFYALLAGFSLPAQRALVMVAVFMLARILSIRLSAAFSFLAAMVLVFVIDPLASVAAGFWLSFTAVAGLLIVFAGEPVVESQPWHKRLWRSWGRAQLIVFVILAAPLISYVGELALLAPLVNALAIPLVSWLVVPLCILALALLNVWPGAAVIIYRVIDALLGVMTAGMEWFAFNAWFPPSWHPQSVSPWMLVFAALASGLLLVPLSWRYRMVAGILVLPLIFPKSNFPQSDDFQLIVLDVGQGLATIIRTANHVLVYDTGAGFEDGFNSGSQILRPVLSHLGVGKLDRLIVSHADNDHAGGAAALLESIGIEQVLGGEIELSLNLMVEACTAGQFWHWDGVEFRILHPANSRSRSYTSANNRSCVLQVSNAEFSILLPGDIEASVENQLASQYGESLHSDVLIAAHHGSNTSSSSRFIAAVEPQVVVFSAGYRSQFGHPTDKVQSRFKALGASLLNTAETGMISFTFPGSKEGSSQKAAPIIEIYRKQHPKYWN